jgi:tRNA-dihydrouridine synthase C
MIGRGMVSDPGLALAIARHDAGECASAGTALSWDEVKALMPVFWQSVTRRVTPRHRAGRMKQWLNYLRRAYPEAQQAFDEMRLVHDSSRIDSWIQAQSRP